MQINSSYATNYADKSFLDIINNEFVLNAFE